MIFSSVAYFTEKKTKELFLSVSLLRKHKFLLEMKTPFLVRATSKTGFFYVRYGFLRHTEANQGLGREHRTDFRIDTREGNKDFRPLRRSSFPVARFGFSQGSRACAA